MADGSSSLFRNKRRHLDITSIIKYNICVTSPVFITLKKWILPIDSIISRYNDLNLRHCVNQIMLKGWKG